VIHAISQLALPSSVRCCSSSLFTHERPENGRRGVYCGVLAMLLAVVATCDQPRVVAMKINRRLDAAGFILAACLPPIAAFPASPHGRHGSTAHPDDPTSRFGGLPPPGGSGKVTIYEVEVTRDPSQLTTFRMTAIVAEIILGISR